MVINLSTLDVDPAVPTNVVQAWSPEFQAWVCIVNEKSAAPPPGTIELTLADIRQMSRLRSEGMAKTQILEALGVLRASPDPGI